MNKSSVISIAIVTLVIVGLGVFAVNRNNSGSNDMGSMNMDNKNSSNNSDTMMVAPNTVVMDDLEFEQKEITVKKGTTVTWKNQDTAKHNVIFDDDSVGKVEDSKLIGNGEELKFTFDKSGEFTYFCEPHPFMKAKVIVTE
ncbi:MAG: plastocyanin/azurin family copper-binding protein [Candidatus Saccharimonadales bacterium]